MNSGIANEEKILLTPEEFRVQGLAKAIGKNSLYDMIRSGRIKSIRVGRKILIPSSELEDFPNREMAE